MTNDTDNLRRELERLRREVPGEVASATSLEAVSEIEARGVGRDSPIAAARRALGGIPSEERKDMGRYINDLADELKAVIAERKAALEVEAEDRALAGEIVDVTLPGRRPRRGSLHLVNEVMDEIVDIFVSIGYTVATGPEAETAFYNFTALNIPETHPARHESDTLYLDYGEVDEEIVLRTHTSPMQARYMEEHDPPVHVVVPGRVFRRDELDPTHSPVFHQVEGLAVDDGITMADLKGTLEYFAHRFFGKERRVRFMPDHFPFTEPSAQMHVSCFNCDMSGCRICAYTGWIELLGCGMVHPAVFEHVGYDPDAVTGFAFGMGADRFALVRHGITDLRHFWESDIRVLEQFV